MPAVQKVKAETKPALKRVLGNNIVEMISQLVISSTPSAIIELLANSYDADATEVQIHYQPDSSLLSISDNGNGMTPEDLAGFYCLGDSPKLLEPISPAGRKRIGKFGVGTILLKYLAKEYTLTTKKEGIETIIHEEFEKVMKNEKGIPFQINKISPHEHGTAIVLHNLNFLDGKEFNLKKLRQQIQWSLWLLPDYQIFINALEVVPKIISNATEFPVEERGASMGYVHGSFYLATRTTEMAGIHIYIHGRSVGVPKNFLSDAASSRPVHSRIVGILHANDLERAILFNRAQLREDDSGIIELKELITREVNKIRLYADDHPVDILKSRKDQQTTLKSITSKLSNHRSPSAFRNLTIQFSASLPQSVLSQYNPKDHAVLLNPHHPFHDDSLPKKAYERILIFSVIDAIALSPLRKLNASLFDRYFHDKLELYTKLFPSTSGNGKTNNLHPDILYDLQHLSQLSGRDLGELKYLSKGGFLKADQQGKILGSSFLEATLRITGLQSLYFFVKHNETEQNFYRRMSQWTDYLDQLNPNQLLEPFVRNLGTQQESCYFIESTTLDFVRMLIGPYLEKRGVLSIKDKLRIVQTVRTKKTTSLSIVDLVQELQGVEQKDIREAIKYASEHGMSIGRKPHDQFSLKDAVTVLQYKRGNLVTS